MVELQRAELGIESGTRFIPIPGTNGYGETWYSEENSPFLIFFRSEAFIPIRASEGRAFKWSGTLDGWSFWNKKENWYSGADALSYFLERIPYEDRNIIAHSHGGQVALILASQGIRIRTLTTVGTPFRHDIPVIEAEKYISFHQHVYDLNFDFIGFIGSIGDGRISTERAFKIKGVENYPLEDISHTRILKDEKYIPIWKTKDLLTNIKIGKRIL